MAWNDFYGDSTNDTCVGINREPVTCVLIKLLETIRTYNPVDRSDIIIFYDAPYDPNHPGRN